MSEATYVAFVPKRKSDMLRQTLTSEDTGALSWKERKTFSGSEFYFTGPPDLARRAHAYVAEWVLHG